LLKLFHQYLYVVLNYQAIKPIALHVLFVPNRDNHLKNPCIVVRIEFHLYCKFFLKDYYLWEESRYNSSKKSANSWVNFVP
jgi:hypothetical protein